SADDREGFTYFSLTDTMTKLLRERRGSLRKGMVVVTDDPCDFPCAVFVLPEMNKFCLTHRLGIIVPGVVEAVNTHFDCAIAFHVVDLQAAWHEFTGYFAADIVLQAIG